MASGYYCVYVHRVPPGPTGWLTAAAVVMGRAVYSILSRVVSYSVGRTKGTRAAQYIFNNRAAGNVVCRKLRVVSLAALSSGERIAKANFTRPGRRLWCPRHTVCVFGTRSPQPGYTSAHAARRQSIQGHKAVVVDVAVFGSSRHRRPLPVCLSRRIRPGQTSHSACPRTMCWISIVRFHSSALGSRHFPAATAADVAPLPPVFVIPVPVACRRGYSLLSCCSELQLLIRHCSRRGRLYN